MQKETFVTCPKCRSTVTTFWVVAGNVGQHYRVMSTLFPLNQMLLRYLHLQMILI